MHESQSQTQQHHERMCPLVYRWDAQRRYLKLAPHEDSNQMFCGTTVKPVVPKCSVPKSVPFGKSAELSCVEEEGFPKSQYQWFKNREEIPDDPKTSLKFFNSSYMLNAETGTLVSMCVRMCLDKDTHEQQGRGSGGTVA